MEKIYIYKRNLEALEAKAEELDVDVSEVIDKLCQTCLSELEGL